jgi:hypothetical protein
MKTIDENKHNQMKINKMAQEDILQDTIGKTDPAYEAMQKRVPQKRVPQKSQIISPQRYQIRKNSCASLESVAPAPTESDRNKGVLLVLDVSNQNMRGT